MEIDKSFPETYNFELCFEDRKPNNMKLSGPRVDIRVFPPFPSIFGALKNSFLGCMETEFWIYPMTLALLVGALVSIGIIWFLATHPFVPVIIPTCNISDSAIVSLSALGENPRNLPNDIDRQLGFLSNSSFSTIYSASSNREKLSVFDLTNQPLSTIDWKPAGTSLTVSITGTASVIVSILHTSLAFANMFATIAWKSSSIPFVRNIIAELLVPLRITSGFAVAVYSIPFTLTIPRASLGTDGLISIGTQIRIGGTSFRYVLNSLTIDAIERPTVC